MSDVDEVVLRETAKQEPVRTSPAVLPDLSAVQQLSARRARRRAGLLAGATATVVLAATAIGVASAQRDEDDLQVPAEAASSTADPASTALARELCAAAGAAYDGPVVGAFPTTVGALRHYLGPSAADNLLQPWGRRSADEAAAVCYVDARIPAPVPQGVPVPDRGQVLVVEGGSPVLSTAGSRTTLLPMPIDATSDRTGPDGPTTPTAMTGSDQEPGYAGPLQHDVDHPNLGIHLSPPPGDAVPGVAWTVAAATCTSGRAACGTGAPHVVLASASTMNGAQIQPDGSVVPTVAGRLVYVLTWPGEPSLPSVPVGPGQVDVQVQSGLFLTLVDATSGAYISAASSSAPGG